MVDQTERPSDAPEHGAAEAEHGTEQSGKNTLATKSLKFCLRVRAALSAVYEEYGAWLILLVACGFFTAVGWSKGTTNAQKIFVEVYNTQQEAFNEQIASYEERIFNLRGMLADKDKTNEQLTKQIANLGGKSADAAKSVSDALKQVPMAPTNKQETDK